MATTHKATPLPSNWHTGKALQQLATRGRLAAEAVATDLGVSSATLYRWYRQRELPERVIEKIALHFGVQPEWLRTGTGPKHVNPSGQAAAIERRAERLMLLYEAELKRTARRYTVALTKAVAGVDILTGLDDDLDA